MIMNKSEMHKISVIVIFFNMRREAQRTLYSLTTDYQRDVNEDDYEVIAIDNGSTEPLEEGLISHMQNNFRYIFFSNNTLSPCGAINYGVRASRYGNIMICIDGARILSPGLLKYMIIGIKMYPNPFVYSLGMHIGNKLQNYLIEEGYNQKVEDKLLSEINWHSNGYKLFAISTLAGSSKHGYFSTIHESNCFTLKKSNFLDIGGFDERFISPGGGLANLDFFNLVNEGKKHSPIMILGEATFHQFHGGIATNVPMEKHPLQQFKEEYFHIRKKKYRNVSRQPEYIGWASRRYHSKLIPFPEFQQSETALPILKKLIKFLSTIIKLNISTFRGIFKAS